MTKMRWRVFLLDDLTGPAAFSLSYIIIGYLFGKQWTFLRTWLGPVPLYLILAAIVLGVPGVMFRHALVIVRVFVGVISNRRWGCLRKR
jgi:membrane protein DedA with SNARE-associated domain